MHRHPPQRHLPAPSSAAALRVLRWLRSRGERVVFLGKVIALAQAKRWLVADADAQRAQETGHAA